MLKVAATSTIAAAGIAGTAGITACSGPSRSSAPPLSGPVSLDERVRRSAAATEAALAAQASALSRSWSAKRAPASAIDLAAAQAAAHTVHASALLRGLPHPTTASGTATGASASTASVSAVGASAGPPTGAALARELDAAVTGYSRELVPLAPASATLLASIAASDSAFAALLRAAGH